nr:uncharacterized protein LOC129382872 [Dermacentor andersoni]
MGKKCFVPNCKSGYRTCTERVSLFKAPREPERLEKWRRAIPRADRVLQPTDHVCAKHFPNEVISATYHAEYKGNVLLHAQKKPVLSPDAVPSIFPNCPGYLTVQQKTRKPPRKRQALPPTSQKPKKQGQPEASNASEELHLAVENTPSLLLVDTTSSKYSDAESTDAPCKRPRLDFSSVAPPPREEKDPFQHDTDTLSGTCTADAPSHTAEKQQVSSSSQKTTEQERSHGPTQEQRPTESLFLQDGGQQMTISALSGCASSLKLPSEAWAVQVSDRFGVKSVVFSELELPKESNQAPFHRKVLEVTTSHNDSLSVKCFVYGRFVNVQTISSGLPMNSLADIECAVRVFHEMHVCAGGPSGEMYNNIRPECAYIDKCGTWRHNRCLLVTESTSCNACAKLKDVLRIHAARKKKNSQLKHIRIPASPSKKTRIEMLRRARIACYKSKVRLQKQKHNLEQELANCKSKLLEISNETLERLSREANLPEAQKLVLKECVAAGKARSKNGRRYSDDWILLCLLLHIRSPGGYRFLMESEILALPSVRTIHRYISLEPSFATKVPEKGGTLD